MDYTSSLLQSEIMSKIKSQLSELLHSDAPLYPVQEKALSRLLEETEKRTRLVFQLPTGAGKTRVVAAYIWGLYYLNKIRPGNKIIFITPRIVIREQVIEKEFQLLRKEPFTIENLGGDVLTDKLYGRLLSLEKLLGPEKRIQIIVITLKLLTEYYNKYDKRGFENVKAIFLDEGHFAYWGAKNFEPLSKLIEGEDRIILAFSATPTSDLIKNLGTPIYHYHSLDAMSEGILISKLKIYPYYIIVANMDESRFNKVLINDRAQKIAEETLRILEGEAKDLGFDLRKRVPKTLIVAANVREADKIYQKLKELIPEKSSVIRLAHYKTEYSPSEEVERFKRLSEGILVTVNMADMGFDDRNLETLVIARRIKTPVAYVQIRGRVLRRHDTNDPNNIKKRKKYAVLVDFTGSISEHEKQEVIKRVEKGEFPSEGVYADLVGTLEEGEIEEIDTRVEICRNKPFMIPEESVESLEDVKKRVKQLIENFKSSSKKLDELDLEGRLKELGKLIEEKKKEIGEIEREIEERNEKSKKLGETIRNLIIDSEKQETCETLIENECVIAVLKTILEIIRKMKEFFESIHNQIKDEIEKRPEKIIQKESIEPPRIEIPKQEVKVVVSSDKSSATSYQSISDLKKVIGQVLMEGFTEFLVEFPFDERKTVEDCLKSVEKIYNLTRVGELDVFDNINKTISTRKIRYMISKKFRNVNRTT